MKYCTRDDYIISDKKFRLVPSVTNCYQYNKYCKLKIIKILVSDSRLQQSSSSWENHTKMSVAAEHCRYSPQLHTCKYSQKYTHTETLTSIFSLQNSLEVFEGARLFGFRDRLHVVLQHLVDI